MPPPREGRFAHSRAPLVVAVALMTAAVSAVLCSAPTASATPGSLLARFRMDPAGGTRAESSAGGPAEQPSSEAAPRASRVKVMVEPAVADGYRGWRTTPTRVTLVPEGPGRVMYAWDSTFGRWEPSPGTLAVPEGRHTLYVHVVDGDGAGLVDGIDLKVDYRAKPVRSAAVRVSDIGSYSGAGSAAGAVVVRAQVGTSGGGDPGGGGQVRRLAGANRYGTSVAISSDTFTSASALVIATGADFADALSASGLAGSLGGPILLTTPSALPASVEAEIRRLAPSRIVIVGGTRAVGPAVESRLRSLASSVTRIGGANRYATAALIAGEIVRREGSGAKQRVYVARGDVFADALSVSPFAYRGRSPVLLVLPGGVPEYTLSAVRGGGFGTMVIAGGPKAVDYAVETQLREYASGTMRVAGQDRYFTAAQAAAYGVGEGLGSFAFVSVATGRTFPDALCGGAATGSRGGVMLLCPGTDLGSAARGAISANVGSIREVAVLGGTAAVAAPVQAEIAAILQR